MSDSTRAAIRDYIVNTWLSGDDRGFDDDTDLQETGVLDSFATLDLTSFLGETFGVQLDPADVNADTFRSVTTLTELIETKKTD